MQQCPPPPAPHAMQQCSNAPGHAVMLLHGPPCGHGMQQCSWLACGGDHTLRRGPHLCPRTCAPCTGIVPIGPAWPSPVGPACPPHRPIALWQGPSPVSASRGSLAPHGPITVQCAIPALHPAAPGYPGPHVLHDHHGVSPGLCVLHGAGQTFLEQG